MIALISASGSHNEQQTRSVSAVTINRGNEQITVKSPAASLPMKGNTFLTDADSRPTSEHSAKKPPKPPSTGNERMI